MPLAVAPPTAMPMSGFGASHDSRFKSADTFGPGPGGYTQTLSSFLGGQDGSEANSHAPPGQLIWKTKPGCVPRSAYRLEPLASNMSCVSRATDQPCLRLAMASGSHASVTGSTLRSVQPSSASVVAAATVMPYSSERQRQVGCGQFGIATASTTHHQRSFLARKLPPLRPEFKSQWTNFWAGHLRNYDPELLG